ncbi:MAG: hypothetical protein P1P73_05390 [Brevefilum sp.]|nr:hypothetical protein [Brevefilum sp.]
MRKQFKRTAFIILLIPILFFSVFSTVDLEGDNELIPSFLNTFKNSDVNAQTPQRVYIASSPAECGSFTPCYTNTDGLDEPNGTGTGLRDAVNALNPGDEIAILGNYLVKDHTVLIDKNLTIKGQDNSLITYNGVNCSVPMLNFTAGGILKDLTIVGADCSGVSRDLVSVNSPVDLSIEHTTLTNGGRAVDIKSGDGTVTLAFNHITGNQDYALYQGEGLGSGTVKIYANNIHSNRTGAQVNCNNLGNADHNFWGEGVLASTGAEFCTVSEAKTLGAPILPETNAPGVQALMQTVTDTYAAAFDNNIAVKRNSGSNYDLFIVNHGQGTSENIPFLGVGTTPIIACSNFYDIFLAEGAVASDLVLSIKYDLNADCISTIESVDFCGSNDSSKIPLWWYAPLNNLTDGWDRTGQIPAGDNPLNESGQLTGCNTVEDSLQVVIDASGRPGINKDLNFTPFLAGLPVGSSDIKTFGAVLDLDEVNLSWETGIESSISGYHVLRASSEIGPYSRISPIINAIGSNAHYQYTDVLNTSDFNKNFYYKIEIINSYGDTIRTHGPQSILTSTPTPTFTPTKTPTPTRTLYPTRTPYPTSTLGPTRTATLYFYRSPTSYYRPGTSTPFNTPTQVRTDRALETEVSPTITEISPSEQTPSPEFITSTSTKSTTPLPTNTLHPTATPTQVTTQEPAINDQEQNPWVFLLIGSFSGLAILGFVSVLLSKTYFY